MDQKERDQLLSGIGVSNDSDGLHITLKNDKQRNALADTIRNSNTPVSFGSSPRVFIEPEGARA